MTIMFPAMQWPCLNNRGCNPQETEQKNEFDWMPESIGREMGQFNVFRLEPCAGDRAILVPYMRPGFYKIALFTGYGKIHFADKVEELKNQSLVFYNPGIPVKSVYGKSIPPGYYCIFSLDFFDQYKSFDQYEVFQPNAKQVFDLNEEQAGRLSDYFEQMLREIDSNYIYKFDVLRNIVYEVLHFALKLHAKWDLAK